MTRVYSLSAKVWLYPGKAAWHFITLPIETAKDIDYYFGFEKRGWGSIPVAVTISNTTWNTSIFTDKKNQSYLLPLKSSVRKAENITADQSIHLTLTVGNE